MTNRWEGFGTGGRMRRWWAPVGVAPLLALTLACGGDRAGDQQNGARTGGTVVIAGPVDLAALNPFSAVESVTQEFLRHVLFLPLVRMQEDMTPAPGLAESWEVDGDTVVTFRLRDDVRWHDGAPVTAEDVAFTFAAVKDTATAYPDLIRFAAWDAVEVVDQRTVRFRVQPAPDLFTGWMFLPIAPAHVLGDVPREELARAAFNEQPIGNGPFRFVSRLANDRVVFEANTDFPEGLGGRPNVDRLLYRVVPEATARVAELVSGGADLVLNYPLDALAQLTGGMSAVETEARQVSFVGWNARRPPLDDARVRRAMTLGIDRREIVAARREGHGSVASSIIPPGFWAWDAELAPLPYDPEAARELLAEAGYADRDGDGLVEDASGSPLTIVLEYPGQDPNFRASSEMIRSDLEGIGVDLEARGMEGNTLIANITGPARDFDAVLLSFEVDLRPNLYDLFHAEASDGPFAFAGYSSPELDAVIDSLALNLEREDERELWTRAQAILARDQPWSFLYYFPNLAGASARLRGVEMDVRGQLATVTDWWIGTGAAAAGDAAAPAPTEAPEEEPAASGAAGG